jgi:hypothetical protein
MAKSSPDFLFRCCSSTSVGRLDSGKYLLYANQSPLRHSKLLLEFDFHSRPRDTTPTALVSTTTNFLRVLHLAIDKLWEGEDAASIEIVMITPGTEAGVRLHHAKELASQIGRPEGDIANYEYEYVFERQIPEHIVSHRITLATLARRGFTLYHLCGDTAYDEFPEMLDFQQSIRRHWRRFSLFDRGFKAATAACLFGYHNFTGRMVDEMLGLVSNFNPYGRVKPFGLVEEGIRDALELYASTIGDNLMFNEADLADLSEDATTLDHEFVVEAEEIMREYCDEASIAQLHLAALETEHCSNHAALTSRLADIYLQIGY